MDPITLGFINNVAAGYFVNFSQAVVRRFFELAIARRPALREEISRVLTNEDIERIFREAVGVIDAAAGRGSLDVDSSFLSAVRGIRFDHQHGQVSIQGSTINAPVLKTGGSGSSTGKTIMSDAVLTSKGTSIHIGKGASIVMTGGASITQT